MSDTSRFSINLCIKIMIYVIPKGSPHSSVSKESTCNAGYPSSIPGSGRSATGGIGYPLQYSWASLVAQLVKNPPAMWETRVQSLVGKIPWRRERLPTPVFWPGEFHGLYSQWGHKELDTTEQLSLFTFILGYKRHLWIIQATVYFSCYWHFGHPSHDGQEFNGGRKLNLAWAKIRFGHLSICLFIYSFTSGLAFISVSRLHIPTMLKGLPMLNKCKRGAENNPTVCLKFV